MAIVINTREDLDVLTGTPKHDEFMSYLKGSMTRKVDTAIYPDGYGKPDYAGGLVIPAWTDVQDLSVIERFGFTATDFA